MPISFTNGADPIGDIHTAGVAEGRMVFGDFDNDGDLDILYQDGNTAGSAFGYMRNNGAGVFTDFTNANDAGLPFDTFDFTGQQLTSLFVVDYDNDGDADIIDRETSGGLSVWRNVLGAFSLQADPIGDIHTAANAEGRMVFGDFDNDGDLDILYQDGAGAGVGFGYMRNNGAGVFADFTDANDAGLPFDTFDFTGQQLATTGLFVVDYDRDGDVDIVDRDTNGGLGIWRNDLGVFSLQADPIGDIHTAANAEGRMVFGDFDSDGDLDILYQDGATAGTAFGYMRNNGAGAFTDFTNANDAGLPFDTFDFTGQQLSGLFVVDYDDDGDVDIVDRETSGGLGVWIQGSTTGDGSPPTLASSNPTDGATGIAVGANFVLTFDEAVSKGSGNIEIVRTSDNLVVETISVGSAQVTGSGTTWTIDPSITLAGSTGYAIRLAPGTFVDGDGAIFLGIADNTTLNFTTAAVNAAPTLGANAGLALNEGATATVTGTALDFNDAEQADTAITYTVTSATANGALALNGTPLGVGGTFTQDDIANNRITYAHNGGETITDSFGFSVSDGAGGSVTGQSFSIAVTAVNDTPVATVPGVNIVGYEGTLISLTGMQVSDADAGGATVNINLIMDQGRILVSNAVPGGVTTADPNPAPVVVMGFTGTLAQVNATFAAAGAVQLDTGADFYGTVRIDLLISDQGATGLDPGGPLPNAEYDVKTFYVDVLPVNDAPVLDLDSAAAGNDATASYRVGDAVLALAPAAVLTDDNASFDGGTLTIAFTANGTADDQLSIIGTGTGTGEISVSGSDVSYEGTVVGTFTGGDNGNPLVVTFNADACGCAVQTIMASIGFANTSPGTDLTDRTITFTLIDGGGTANSGEDTGAADVVLSLSPPNVAPTVSILSAPVGGETQVNSFTTNNQIGSKVAGLEGGDYVVVWSSFDQIGASWDIYLQRYDAAGIAQGGETLINSTTADLQLNPAVAALVGGGYVVTWQSSGQDGSGDGIYAQRYDAAGDALGGEVLVNTTTFNNQGEAEVTALASGGYVVTWRSFGQDGDNWGIYAQRFDAAGAPDGSETQINTYTTDQQRAVDVAALAGGGYVVTWESYNQDDGSFAGVYAQLYEADGDPVGVETRVNTTTANFQLEPSAAGLGGGGYVIVWASYFQDGSGTGVYAQRYDAAGNALGGEVLVNTTIAGNQRNPTVAALADGGYLVTWHSDGQDGSGLGVYAQRFDAAGNQVGGETLVNSFTTGDQVLPDIAGLADGGYVAAWTSDGQDGDLGGIYAQRFGLSATEQVPLDLKGTIVLGDPDASGTITVVLSVNLGTLNIEAGTSGATVTEIFPNEWEVSGTLAELQALFGSDPGSVVEYLYDFDYPLGPDELTVDIDDGSASSSASATIEITPVNDAPIIDLDFFTLVETDTQLLWTEGDGPTLLAPAAIFVDDDEDNSYPGATLTVSIDGATSGDQLTIDTNPDITVVGSDVYYDDGTGDVLVGSFTGGTNGADLVITFNADACACSIELTMASILFENTDNLTVPSSRTVDFTLVDGGGTALGGIDTGAASVVLVVAPEPRVEPGPDETGNEDSPIPLTGVVIDGVASDPANDVVTVWLHVGNGTLTIRTDVTNGLLAADVTGNGSDTLELTGTQDAINATLAATDGLVYQGDPEYSGSDTLEVIADGGVVAGLLPFSDGGEFDIGEPILRLDFHDLDGDGASDLVYGRTDTLGLFSASAPGGIELPLPETGIPTGFAFGHFDGDGTLDIAVAVSAPGAGYVAIFSSLSGIAKVADVDSAFDIVTGDFDGDGLADLAVSDPLSSRVGILLGNGTPLSFTTPTTSLAATLAIGDFNNDTFVDLLVGNAGELAPGPVPPGSIDLLLGNGDGTFQAAVEVLSTPASPGEIVVADFDGDGELDFAFASAADGAGTNGVVVALGIGDGTFAPAVGYQTTATGAPGQLVAADFDGDGVLDLAVANNTNPSGFDPPSVSILVGNGDGSFRDPYDIDVIDSPFAIAAGDPDGDGDTDFAVGSLNGFIDGFENDLDLTARQGSTTKGITINAANDAPTSTNLAGDSVTWIEGSAPALLDSGTDATFADIDSTDFDGGSLSVQVTGGLAVTEDFLSIVDQGTGPGQIGLAGTDVTYGGVVIGTSNGAGGAGTTLTVTFNANATPAAVAALAQAIAYSNASVDPTEGTRTVSWTLADGDGTANGGDETLDFTSSVVVVNGDPALDLNGVDPGTSSAITYDEGDGLTVIAPNATVTDPNTSSLDGGVLTVEITGNGGVDDYLGLIPGAGGGLFSVEEVDLYYDFGVVGPELIGMISGGVGGGPLVITFNGAATLAVVEQLVRAIGFANYWSAPGALQREVTFTLTDGDDDTSAPVIATIDVNQQSDPAQARDDTFAANENELRTGSLFTNNGDGPDFDPESDTFEVTHVNGSAALVGSTFALASGALLRVNADGTFTYDPNGAFNSLVPGSSGAANFEANDSFTYTITGGSTATAQVTVTGIVSVGDQYRGDAGNNAITATSAADYFDLSQGGEDSAFGLGGNDAFYFGAAFDENDTVDGGDGTNDQIGLEGDYSGGNALTLGAGPGTISNVEVIALLAGFDYDITVLDAAVPAGATLKIFATGLGAGDNLTFDGSAETSGAFMVYGGLGTDLITTGGGNDSVYFGPGRFDPLVDRVDGGTGSNDQMALDGDYTLTLESASISNMDVLALLKGKPADLADYDITVGDSLIGAGETFVIWGTTLETALTVDGSGETDGNLRIYGGTLGDALTGGDGDDWIWGGLGKDTIEGGDGADTFYYENAAQSKFGNVDLLVGFDDSEDTIDLPFAVAGLTSLSGGLDAVTMDSMLEIAFASLGIHHAAVFNATGGDLIGRTFLLVDVNGTTGYQASGDLMIELGSPVSAIDQLGMFV